MVIYVPVKCLWKPALLNYVTLALFSSDLIGQCKDSNPKIEIVRKSWSFLLITWHFWSRVFWTYICISFFQMIYLTEWVPLNVSTTLLLQGLPCILLSEIVGMYSNKICCFPSIWQNKNQQNTHLNLCHKLETLSGDEILFLP